MLATRLVALLSLSLVAPATPATASASGPAEDAPESIASRLPSAEAVLKHLDELYGGRTQGSHAKVRVVTHAGRYDVEMKLEIWSSGRKGALVVTKGPKPREGLASVRNEEGIFDYAPRRDRFSPVSPQQLSERWMGTYFTYEDMLHATRYAEDYEAAIEAAELVDETRLQLTLEPREGAGVVWSKILVWVTPATWRPVRADYYRDSRLVRRLNWSSPEKLAGHPMSTVIEVTPMANPKHSSRLVYEELELDGKPPEKRFSRQAVRRTAREADD